MKARALLGFFVVFTLGCGGKGSGGPPEVGAGGSGGSNVGGSSSGGAAGVAGASGGAAGATGCVDVFHVNGSLDGNTIQGDLGYTPATAFWSNSFEVVFTNGGVLVVEGTGEANDGDVVQAPGYFAAPVNSFLNGQHFAVGNVSFTFGDLSQPITLSSLSKTGVCPGTPLSGSIHVCSPSGLATTECQGQFEITGSLGGAPVDELHDEGGYLYTIMGFLEGEQVGVMVMGTLDRGFLGAQGKHSGMSGVFVWPETGAYAGKALCYDKGEYLDVDQSMATDVSGLSEVGPTTGGTPATGDLTLTFEACPD